MPDEFITSSVAHLHRRQVRAPDEYKGQGPLAAQAWLATLQLWWCHSKGHYFVLENVSGLRCDLWMWVWNIPKKFDNHPWDITPIHSIPKSSKIHHRSSIPVALTALCWVWSTAGGAAQWLDLALAWREAQARDSTSVKNCDFTKGVPENQRKWWPEMVRMARNIQKSTVEMFSNGNWVD